MSWGKKIIAVYVVFIVGIMFLVFKASSQNDDLVTADYYGKELKYQQRIDETNRTDAMPDSVQYTVSAVKTHLRFPKQFEGKTISGELLLYCPSDEKKDIRKTFSINTTETDFEHNKIGGSFELQISWKVDGVNYYLTRKIFI